MKSLYSVILAFVILVVALPSFGQGSFRRATPPVGGIPRIQYYIVDSDDNLSIKPTYHFTDTLYQPGTWKRISFTDNDAGIKDIAVAPVNMKWYNRSFSVGSNTYAGVNGTLSFSPGYGPDGDETLPVQTAPAFLAALWSDFEIRTTKDSTKIFARATTDSILVSYYNLALKGTEGKIRATFQIAITPKDTSVTVNYKSFDGTYEGLSAASIIQRNAVIGMQDSVGANYINYLSKGYFYAKSQSSSLYEQPLHNQFAVKFYYGGRDAYRLRSVYFPAYDNYEVTTANFAPIVEAQNIADTTLTLVVKTTLRNITRQQTLFQRTDTLFDVLKNEQRRTNTTSYPNLPCGEYLLSATISSPSVPKDAWEGDNYIERHFVKLNEISYPVNAESTTELDSCMWSAIGATTESDVLVMGDPTSPTYGGTRAIVLDRIASDGQYYKNAGSGDTLLLAPVDLSGKSDVWLNFNYRRGLATDSTQAGIQFRTLSGPESGYNNTTSGISRRGDTLFVQLLTSSGAKFNANESSWITVAKLNGGLDDTSTQVFRYKLPSSYIHDHSRVRFLLRAYDHGAAIGLPQDDRDAYVIDGFQIQNPGNGKTELSVTDLGLGNNLFTHVPRDIGVLNPAMRVTNNGNTPITVSYLARLIITDQLSREVYHMTTGFIPPAAHKDSIVTFPLWNIKGSQGGTFTARASLEQVFSDSYHTNDTNTYKRTLKIDDVYAYDDGTPDTAGTSTSPTKDFYIRFTPLATDSLRAFDIYYLTTDLQASWVLDILDGNTTVSSQGFALNPSTAGFTRSSIQPVKLTAGKTYDIHLKSISNALIGGDASRSYIDLLTSDIQHRPVLQLFRNSAKVTFDTALTNLSGGGPLLPMVRMVYTGSAQYLPVDLLGFTGRRSDRAIDLNWQTATEKQAATFTVERQTADARRGDTWRGDAWTVVGILAAANASNGSQYQMRDVDAPQTAVRYRLSQSDLDGTEHRLGTVAIGPVAVGAGSISVYPNPASQRINIDLKGEMPSMLRIVNAAGAEIAHFDNMPSSLALDVTVWASGSYLLEVVYGEGRVVRSSFRVVK